MRGNDDGGVDRRGGARHEVGWLFVLTGRDGRGRPDESEVSVPAEVEPSY